MAVLKRKVPVWAWILDWTIVFIGNLAGSLLYAGFVLGSGILTNDSVTAFGESVVKFGDTKMSASFGQILIRGQYFFDSASKISDLVPNQYLHQRSQISVWNQICIFLFE